MDSIETMEHEILLEMREQPEKYEVIENEYCTVDDITRVVTVPEQYKTLGVEPDQAVKKIWFRFPRIVGNNNTDLSVLSVRIHYRNANGDIDGYIVKDLEADGEDNVIFSWEIGGNVALYKGNVEFIVCAVRTDDEGLIHREWNTKLNKDCVVLEGLELGKIEIKPTEKDIIAQLIQYVKDESAEAVKQVTASKEESILAVKNEGSKQIENVQNEAEKIIAEREQIEKNKTDIATLNEEMELLAPAIICTASGGSIKVDDSAERRAQGFGLHGKTEQTKTLGRNLMNNVTNDTNKNFVDAVIKDDEYVITVKTDNASSAHRIFVIPKVTKDFNGKTIAISDYDTISENGGTTRISLFVVNINNGVASHFRTVTDLKPSQKYTFGQDIVYDNPNLFVALALYANNTDNSKAGQKVTYKNLYAYFEDESLTEWEPFTGLKPSPSPDYPQEIQSIGEEKEGKYSVDVKTIGKNLLDADKYYSDMKVGDIFEDTTNNFYKIKIPLPKQFIGKKLTFSALLYQVNARSNIRCSARIGGNVNDGNGSSKMNEWFLSKISFTMMNESDTIFFNYGLRNNVRIKNIQLEENSEQTSYEPYKESSFGALLDQPLYEGDKIYLEDGELWEYRENAKVVFDGSEDEGWRNYSSTDTEHIFCISNINLNASRAKQYCNRFNFRYAVTHPYNGLFGAGVNAIYFGVLRTIVSDLQEWKTWLKSNPIEVVYKLATPTLKKLGRIEDFGELKTYYPITHITNNEDAEMVVEYVADTKNYVDNKVAANVANIISQYQTNISNLLSLMPIETQAAMIENDTNNILESEVTQ